MSVAPPPAPALVEARCLGCQKRLFDYISTIRAGAVLIRKRCRHCHVMNEIEVRAS